jgi:peptidoglycan/LPS O-acetylase OafA/YrhL
LSAFLLARPFWTEVLGGERVHLRTYARRRVWRIVPLYALAVAAAAVATSTTAAEYLRALPYLLFVPQDFLPAASRFPPTFSAAWWSLSTEAQFYLLLPFLVVAHRSRAGRWAGALVLASVVAGYALLAAGGWPGISWATLFTCAHTVVGRAPLFAWGIAAAYASVRFFGGSRPARACPAWLRNGGADLLLLAFVATAFAALSWVESSMQYATLEAFLPTWHVAEGAAWAVVVLAVLYAPLRWRRALTAGPLVWTGQISYSIYLLHMPVLGYGLWALHTATGAPLRGWSVASALAILLLVAVTIALASLTYRWIEVPMIRRGRRAAQGAGGASDGTQSSAGRSRSSVTDPNWFVTNRWCGPTNGSDVLATRES